MAVRFALAFLCMAVALDAGVAAPVADKEALAAMLMDALEQKAAEIQHHANSMQDARARQYANAQQYVDRQQFAQQYPVGNQQFGDEQWYPIENQQIYEEQYPIENQQIYDQQYPVGNQQFGNKQQFMDEQQYPVGNQQFGHKQQYADAMQFETVEKLRQLLQQYGKEQQFGKTDEQQFGEEEQYGYKHRPLAIQNDKPVQYIPQFQQSNRAKAMGVADGRPSNQMARKDSVKEEQVKDMADTDAIGQLVRMLIQQRRPTGGLG